MTMDELRLQQNTHYLISTVLYEDYDTVFVIQLPKINDYLTIDIFSSASGTLYDFRNFADKLVKYLSELNKYQLYALVSYNRHFGSYCDICRNYSKTINIATLSHAEIDQFLIEHQALFAKINLQLNTLHKLKLVENIC